MTESNLTATTISSEINKLGLNSSGSIVYQYTYTVSGLTLQSTQELDIYFDPAIYGSVSNPVAGSEFQTVLIQPNNPPGSSGDLGLVPVADNTVVTGPFSVDFTLIDSAVPGPQPYTVTQFLNGVSIGVIASGTTSPVSSVVTPEPAAVFLAAIGLLLGACWVFARASAVRRV
jgi:hypothetical protein